MGFGPFSTESQTKQNTTDNRIAADNQSVVVRIGAKSKLDDHQNRSKNIVTLGKNATLTNNYTSNSPADIGNAINPGLTALAASFQASRTSTGDNGLSQAVTDALNSRVADSTTAAHDNVETGLPSKSAHYILYSLAFLAIVIVVWLFKRKGHS